MTPDQAYANGAYIPGADAYVERWEDDARAWRNVESAVGRARLNLAYGPHERQRFDLFYPAGQPAGLLVFVHGGYWKALGREYFSHLARGATARGWAVALPSYRLAPEVRVADITRDIAAAVDAAASRIAGPLVLAGHSAGGHLVARMACHDVDLAARGRIVRIVPISPLGDLRPLTETSMNADLRLDAAEAQAESPALHSDAMPIDTVVWVGAEERPAFLDQARGLAGAWDNAALRIAPGRHHFDVIEEMEDSASPLTSAMLDGLSD